MPDHVYKTVEITGSSPNNVDEAIRNAISKASQTLRHLEWFEVIDVRGMIADNALAYYQVTVKLGFRLED